MNSNNIENSIENILNFYIENPLINKSSDDIEKLYIYYQTMPYFKKISETNEHSRFIIKTILEKIEFRKINKNITIWEYNSNVSYMIILFKGTINVYKKLNLNKNIFKKRKNNSCEKSQHLFKNLYKNFNKFLDYELEKGNCIGDELLKNKIKKHDFIIETKTDCIIGFLSLTNYSLIFEKTELLEQNDLRELLMSINVFKNTSEIFFDNLINILVKKVYKKGQILFNKGDEYKYFYLINKGLFQLNLDIVKKIRSKFDLLNLNKNIKNFTNSQNFLLNNEYNEKYNYKLINLGDREFIGEIEMKYNSENYMYNAVCNLDNSEIFQIDVKKFIKICSEDLYKKFLSEINNKIEKLNIRLINIIEINKKSFMKKNKFIKEINSYYDSLNYDESKDKYINDIRKPLKFKINFNKKKLNNIQYNTSNFTLKKTIKKKKNIKFDTKDDIFSIYSTNQSLKRNSSDFISKTSLNRRINNKILDNFQNKTKNLRLKLNNRINISNFMKNTHILKKNNSANVLTSNNFNSLISFNSEKKLINEKHKINFPKCFEINKKIYTTNKANVFTPRNIKKLFLSNK